MQLCYPWNQKSNLPRGGNSLDATGQLSSCHSEYVNDLYLFGICNPSSPWRKSNCVAPSNTVTWERRWECVSYRQHDVLSPYHTSEMVILESARTSMANITDIWKDVSPPNRGYRLHIFKYLNSKLRSFCFQFRFPELTWGMQSIWPHQFTH